MAVLSRLDILLHADTASATQNIRNFASNSVGSFENVKEKAKTVGVALGAMATTAAVALGAMVKEQVALANELANTARIAGTSAVAIQKYTFAAKAMGIEQEKLGDIFKDTQDKVGDFLSTGGGEMADFFKNVAPQIGLTAESMRELSGPDALQAVYNGLEKANLSQSEMIFYMEGIADEASLLIPLLADGGAGFKMWAEAAENAGAVMDEKTIKASQELKASTDLLNLSYQGVKNQLTQALIPVLGDLASSLVKDATLKNQARAAGDFLAQSFKVIAATGVGVVTIVQSIGKAIGGLAVIMASWSHITDGVDFSSPFAFFQLAKNAVTTVPMEALQRLKDVTSDIVSDYKNADATMGRIFAMGTTGTNAQINSLVKMQNHTKEIQALRGKTGKQIQDETEATKKLTAEREKAAKAGMGVVKGGLVGVSGNTGIGSGPHLHIQTADGSRPLTNSELDRFQAGGKNLTSWKRTSGYGGRHAPVAGASTFHKGIDIGMPIGTPITTNVPVVSVKPYQGNAKSGFISLVTFADGLQVKLVHQDPSLMSKVKGGSAAASLKTNTNDYQLMVFQAWKKAGLSEQQSKIMTAEVGRENAYNPATLFGYHKDASNGKINVGMLSWQKERGKELEQYLRSVGVMHGNVMDNSQESLNAMAQFAVKEMMTMQRFAKTKNEFLADKDIDTQKAFAITGDNYIAWDRSGSAVLGAAGAAKHAARRDSYYNQISAKVGMSGGGGIADTLAKEEAEAKRLEDLRLQITKQYADKQRQIEMNLVEEIKRIKASGFDAENEKKYIAQATQNAQLEINQYRTTQNQKLASLQDFAKSEADLIRERSQRERDEINNNAEYQKEVNKQHKEAMLSAIDAKEAYELEKYQQTQAKKMADMLDFEKSDLQRIRDTYEYERQQIALSNDMTMDDRTMALAANTRKEARDIGNLQKDHVDRFNNLNNEMSGTSEYASLQAQYTSRLEIIKQALDNEVIATEQAEQAKAAIHREYASATATLTLTNMENIASTISQTTGELVGKQSRAYRVMFAIEKGMAIARSIIAIQTGLAQAASLPFPLNLPAMGTVVAATASIISNIRAVAQPQLAGQAHDGIENIPREGTWLLDKGERVVKPRDNQRLTQFLDNQPKQLNQNNPALNVQINNNAPVEVTTRTADDGQLIVTIDERIRQSWGRVSGDANSHESKMLKQGFAVRPNR